MLKSNLFYCENGVNYPPFKDGLYLEEFFLYKIKENNPNTERKYIPALWTNFQIKPWFNRKKREMQKILNDWINKNPSNKGYYTIVQYDDSCLLNLPLDTIVYGACSGDRSIPLIYEDKNNKLLSMNKKNFHEKNIFCSFVGSITYNNLEPNVRKIMVEKLNKNEKYVIKLTEGWSDSVDINKQNNFIETTINSKFCLAPRGYGRSSFRFFEIFQLGSIPIYLWNDIIWLPFQDIIDYKKICIVLNISEIDNLDNILNNIDEDKYLKMFEEYEKIKYLFTLEGMYQKIINEI